MNPYDLANSCTVEEIRESLQDRLPRGMNPYTGRPLTIRRDKVKSIRERMERVKRRRK